MNSNCCNFVYWCITIFHFKKFWPQTVIFIVILFKLISYVDSIQWAVNGKRGFMEYYLKAFFRQNYFNIRECLIYFLHMKASLTYYSYFFIQTILVFLIIMREIYLKWNINIIILEMICYFTPSVFWRANNFLLWPKPICLLNGSLELNFYLILNKFMSKILRWVVLA